MMRWLIKLLFRGQLAERVANDELARESLQSEQLKLQEARSDWKKVNRAHDRLAEWIDESFRRGPTW